MKRKLLFILLISTSLLYMSTSCSKDFKIVESYQSFTKIDTLSLSSVYTVELIQDTINAVEISGSAYYVTRTKMNLTNGHLEIKTLASNKWLHPRKNKVTLKIHLSKIKRINAYETCSITCINTLQSDTIGYTCSSKLNSAELNINCNTFYMWNNFPCGGKLTLTGNCNELKIWSYALLAVDASACTTQNAQLENHSKGTISAKVTNQVKYAIYGSGNIVLHQQPIELIPVNQSGTGSLSVVP